jgi:hypothetical protein
VSSSASSILTEPAFLRESQGSLLSFTIPRRKSRCFRVLKESAAQAKGIHVCLYTRGGDTNSVWPIVSVIREFDPDFEVLVPFRCHGSGTLLALGARRIITVPLSELSPIDPSTGNQFNPPDPFTPGSRLAISVEDVQAYAEFLLRQPEPKGCRKTRCLTFVQFFDKLASQRRA